MNKLFFLSPGLRMIVRIVLPKALSLLQTYKEMKKIGLLSDTHGYWDEKFETYFAPCDEIWHAGDIGSTALADRFEALKPFRAVYGNIDDYKPVSSIRRPCGLP